MPLLEISGLMILASLLHSCNRLSDSGVSKNTFVLKLIDGQLKKNPPFLVVLSRCFLAHNGHSRTVSSWGPKVSMVNVSVSVDYR
jgi:hypothetical protein